MKQMLLRTILTRIRHRTAQTNPAAQTALTAQVMLITQAALTVQTSSNRYERNRYNDSFHTYISVGQLWEYFAYTIIGIKKGKCIIMEAIYSRDLDALIDDRRTLIIDLRSPKEYGQGHIRGAYNIPYETSRERLFRLNKGKNYVLYCERGLTSFKAAREMSQYGYQVKSLINGIRMYKGKYLIQSDQTQEKE